MTTSYIKNWVYLPVLSPRPPINRVTGQNGSGQNGTDKMVWAKWYGQNGTVKPVASFGIVYNSGEINTYLVTKGHK